MGGPPIPLSMGGTMCGPFCIPGPRGFVSGIIGCINPGPAARHAACQLHIKRKSCLKTNLEWCKTST